MRVNPRLCRPCVLTLKDESFPEPSSFSHEFFRYILFCRRCSFWLPRREPLRRSAMTISPWRTGGGFWERRESPRVAAAGRATAWATGSFVCDRPVSVGLDMAMSAWAGAAFLVGSYQRYLSATSHTVPTCVANRFIGDTVVLVLPTGQKSIRDRVLRVTIDLCHTVPMVISRYRFVLPRRRAVYRTREWIVCSTS